MSLLVTTGRATVPQAAQKFVHGFWVGCFVQAVHKLIPFFRGYCLFTAITNMLDSGNTRVVRQLTFLVRQPLEGSPRLIDSSPSPALRGLHGNGVVLIEMMLAPVSIASRRDGDALYKGVETSLALKFLAEFLATPLMNIDVGLAIILQFLLEVKGVVSSDLVCMPLL